MVDVDAAVGEQLFDVAVDTARRRYQRTPRTMTLGGKQKPTKADRGIVAGRGRRVLMTPVCLLGARSQQLQQRPPRLTTSYQGRRLITPRHGRSAKAASNHQTRPLDNGIMLWMF